MSLRPLPFTAALPLLVLAAAPLAPAAAADRGSDVVVSTTDAGRTSASADAGPMSPVATLSEQHALGRISRIEGRAAYFVAAAGAADAAGWSEAIENLPIVSRSSIATEAGGRAEVRIGELSVLVDQDAQADFVRVDARTIEVRVARGGVAIDVPAFDPARALTLVTDRVTLRVRGAGRYVLRQQADGAVLAKALDGQADLKVGAATLGLMTDQQARIDGGQTLSYQREPLAADPFDHWVGDRGGYWQSLATTPFVPAEVTGVDELLAHGQWVQDPVLGPLWVPVAAAPGWAPGQAGQWVVIPPWGPVWVDAAPWGFVTSHRGRWREIGGRWAWMPGPAPRPARMAPPVLAMPAYPAPIYQPPRWNGQPARPPMPARPWQPPLPLAQPRPQQPPMIAQPPRMPAAPAYPQPVPQPAWNPQAPPQFQPPGRIPSPAVGAPMPFPTPPRTYPTPPRPYPTPPRDFAQPSRPVTGPLPHAPLARPANEARSGKYRLE